MEIVLAAARIVLGALLLIYMVRTAARFIGSARQHFEKLGETVRARRRPHASRPVVRTSLLPAGEAISAQRFEWEVHDASRVLFANMIKSIYGAPAKNVLYWKSELLKTKSGDAAEYVARVIEAQWGAAAIWYGLRIWFGESLRGYRQVARLPSSVLDGLDQALTSIEDLFSFESWLPIPIVPAPRGTVVPKFPNVDETLESLSKTLRQHESLDALSRALPGKYRKPERDLNDEIHREVIRQLEQQASEHALWSTYDAFSSEKRVASQPLPIVFGKLASRLVRLSKRDGLPATIAKRCSGLAITCAAQVSREDLNMPELAAAFEETGLGIPEYAPHAVGEQTVKIGVDGSISIESTHQTVSDGVKGQTVERDLVRGIEKSLFGLVGFDQFKPLLAMDVCEFLSSSQSRGRVFWGPTGVGKTEVAQRLSGLRDGFPSLSIGKGEVRYVSGVDGRLEVKDIVDGLPSLSILFIDEADKCLDPGAGMVSPAEATQVRHAIVTHFQRKPLFWVFLGVFSQLRANGKFTDESLAKGFGEELAHRLDFSDWEFPAWTLPNLLKAVNGASSRRKLKYEDEAALLLAQHCIKTGGGVRTFDNLESSILRHMRTAGITTGTTVSRAIAQEILVRRGIQPG